MSHIFWKKPGVLWMHSDRAGCGTYRCYVPALGMDKRGWETEFLLHEEFPRHLGRFEDAFQGVAIVIFQRAVDIWFSKAMDYCTSVGIKTILEMDDDLLHIPKHNPAHAHWQLKHQRKCLLVQIEKADHIIVSTFPLRNMLLEKVGVHPDKVTVCHNHLHPLVWGDKVFVGQDLYNNGDYTVIGWQGSQTHDVDFKECIPALQQLLTEYPKLIVRFFGSIPLTIQGKIPSSRFQWVRGVPFDRYPFTLTHMNFDIGLAPVVDNVFNQSKSNLKWLEYASRRVPCVASRVFPYESSIDHGVTGFVAGTTEEWYSALRQLLDSPDLRKQIGQQAYDHVWQEWGPDRALAWDAVFNKVLNHAQVPDEQSRERRAPVAAYR